MSEEKSCSNDCLLLRKLVLGILLLLIVLVVLQATQVYFLIHPVAQPVVKGMTEQEVKVYQENKKLLEKVSQLTAVGTDEQALILTLDNVEKVRKADPLNAEVYKDAHDGDRIIRFADRMIIYNEAENKIVYEGKTPVQLQQEKYLGELQQILGDVSLLTTLDVQARPQLLTVTDPSILQKQNSVVYKDVQVGDKILAYTDRVIIYRPSTKQIIFDGVLELQPK